MKCRIFINCVYKISSGICQQKFGKSVNICQSDDQKLSVLYFWDTAYKVPSCTLGQQNLSAVARSSANTNQLFNTNVSRDTPLSGSVKMSIHANWSGGAMGRALDLRSTGSGFQPYLGQNFCKNVRQVVHSYVPQSPSSITWYRPRGSDALRMGR